MSIPTVPSNIPRYQYTASASQTIFSVPFPFYANGDFKVYLTPSGAVANDSDDLLSLDVDYTVTGANTLTGGDITLTSPASAGDIITIQREMSVDRVSTYIDGEKITASQLNQDLNRQIMMLQDELAYIKEIIPQYQTSAVIDSAALNLPLLGSNEYWKGGPGGSIIPTTIEENVDCSTLRSDLAQNASALSSGSNLVGYYSALSGATNVQDELDNINSTIAAQNSILDFGGDNTGVSDNTGAFNAALIYYAANPDNNYLYFPPGVYLFNSQPNEITTSLNIVGAGTDSTRLVRNYTEAVNGAGMLSCGDTATAQLKISDLTVLASSGTSGGTGIRYGSSAATAAVPTILNNVRIFGDGGTFAYCLIADGSAFADGIQQVNFDNLYTANSTINDIFLSHCALAFINAQISGTMQVAGSAIFPSSQLNCRLENNSGAAVLSLDYVTNSIFNLSGFASCTNTVNSTNITVFGDVTTKQRNSSTLQYIGFSDFVSNKSGDGYQKLPGGMIFQWRVNATISSGSLSSPTLVNLPISFPNANLGCFGYANSGSAGAVSPVEEIPSFRTLSRLGFIKTAAFPSSTTINIFALGY